MTDPFPEKDRRRALRRHHLRRAKARALFIATLSVRHSSWPLRSGAEIIEMRQREMVRRYRNLAKCSCMMCRNPRRRLIEKQRLTLAERKATISYRQQLDE